MTFDFITQTRKKTVSGKRKGNNMARLYISLFMLLSAHLLSESAPVAEEGKSSPIVEGVIPVNSMATTPKAKETPKVEVITTPTPRASTAIATMPQTTAASPELKIEVIVAPTSSTSKVTMSEQRCCRIGRKAARRGYSCYVDMAILERRLNMPHRYKMKFAVHGPKYGSGFANKLQYCGKDRKRQRIFNHCCEKNAAAMDF